MAGWTQGREKNNVSTRKNRSTSSRERPVTIISRTPRTAPASQNKITLHTQTKPSIKVPECQITRLFRRISINTFVRAPFSTLSLVSGSCRKLLEDEALAYREKNCSKITNNRAKGERVSCPFHTFGYHENVPTVIVVLLLYCKISRRKKKMSAENGAWGPGAGGRGNLCATKKRPQQETSS